MKANCRIGKVRLKQPHNLVVGEFGGELDIPASRVLMSALEANLDAVVVAGYRDGREYFAASYADGGDYLWLLERCKHRLMQIADEVTAS